MRSRVSEKSKYYISPHRYLELRHFCLQYKEWEAALKETNYVSSMSVRPVTRHDRRRKDMTGNTAARRAQLSLYMKMVKDTCFESDESIGKWLFLGVTRGVAFRSLKTLYEIPCEKDMYYDRYRKFFYLLDKKR